MSKKYIISSVLILAVIFSVGTKVSAQGSGQDVKDQTSIGVDGTAGVKVTTDVVATPSTDCKRVDADQNGKLDAQDFAAFGKLVDANNIIRADMDGNKILNPNDYMLFVNAYAVCIHSTNTGVFTGGIKTGGIKPMPAIIPIPTSDDAVVRAQLEKCKTLTNADSMSNCVKVIRAKFPTKIAPIPTRDDDQDGDEHDKDKGNGNINYGSEKQKEDDQVGDESPEQIKAMRARYEQRFAEFNALYTRLTKLADLIEGRIAELSTQKTDVSQAKTRLASARTHLGYARNSIDSTIKIYQTYGPTSNVIRASAEIAKNQLGAARGDLIAATKYLKTHDDQTNLSDACKKFDANGDAKLTTADFAAFDASFKKGDKSADADTNGTLNANDYQAFTNGYARCNPGVTPPTIKPVNTTEPSPIDMKATINTGADTQVQ